MVRRLAGAALVVLTVVAITVMAAAPGRRVAGTPSADAFPSAPAVGDCLIEATDVVTGPMSTAGHPLPRFGRCGDDRTVGEVVAVHPGPLQGRTDCVSEALTRSGLQDHQGSFAPPGQPASDPVRWSYRIAVTASWLPQIPWLPSGSTWAVCVARPIGSRLDHGTLAHAFDRGRLPGDYGTCAQSMDVVSAIPQVNCNRPHVAELITSGWVVDGTTAEWDRISSSCAAQVALVMRRADPAAGGLLRPTALAINVAGDQDHQSVLVPCYVTAGDGRMIVGSLVGLGSGPIKFVG